MLVVFQITFSSSSAVSSINTKRPIIFTLFIVLFLRYSALSWSYYDCHAVSQKLYSLHWVFSRGVTALGTFYILSWKELQKASREAWVNVLYNVKKKQKKNSRSLRHWDSAAVKSNIHPLSTYSWFHLRWKKEEKKKETYSCPGLLQISCGAEDLIALHCMGFIQKCFLEEWKSF